MITEVHSEANGLGYILNLTVWGFKVQPISTILFTDIWRTHANILYEYINESLQLVIITIIMANFICAHYTIFIVTTIIAPIEVHS